MKKNIIFATDALSGGVGRVISLLSNELANRDYNVEIVLFNQSVMEAKVTGIKENIEICSLNECSGQSRSVDRAFRKGIVILARILGKTKRILTNNESDIALILKYYAEHYEKIKKYKDLIKSCKSPIIISFLNAPIFATLLAVNSNSKVIISERNDPVRYEKSKTTMAFIRKLYPKTDYMVFQTEYAESWYKRNTKVNGKVIFNPIKHGLPTWYDKNRKLRIVNFCRISEQKNLPLLINAYEKLRKVYPEYDLYIYGDAVGNGAEGYLEYIETLIMNKGLGESVHVLPGIYDIHEEIKDYAMFVSSSDFEGMSNSMLEAMAMGMPVVCTDCPAGGARAVIQDHENGLLVPVKDEEKLYLAMKEIIENPELAEKISKTAIKIREEQSIEKIMKQWMELIDG